ncbi:MAG: hypothetical protein IPJ51_13455 [Saprospiraceae bacterium]|nr:hypothetical protein [Saprospiraceae bacterium]
MERIKQGLMVVDAEAYRNDEDRYVLRVNDPEAPLCPYGNKRVYIGFDRYKNNYIRFTKTILRKLLLKQDDK